MQVGPGDGSRNYQGARSPCSAISSTSSRHKPPSSYRRHVRRFPQYVGPTQSLSVREPPRRGGNTSASLAPSLSGKPNSRLPPVPEATGRSRTGGLLHSALVSANGRAGGCCDLGGLHLSEEEREPSGTLSAAETFPPCLVDIAREVAAALAGRRCQHPKLHGATTAEMPGRTRRGGGEPEEGSPRAGGEMRANRAPRACSAPASRRPI
jgi:hypothetical protein